MIECVQPLNHVVNNLSAGAGARPRHPRPGGPGRGDPGVEVCAPARAAAAAAQSTEKFLLSTMYCLYLLPGFLRTMLGMSLSATWTST